jgi:hypothetical protein
VNANGWAQPTEENLGSLLNRQINVVLFSSVFSRRNTVLSSTLSKIEDVAAQ